MDIPGPSAIEPGWEFVANRRRWSAVAVVAVLACGAAAAFMVRPDLVALDPVRLRLDNWRTAAWVWSTSPVAGVGFGGAITHCQRCKVKVVVRHRIIITVRPVGS